MASGRNVLAPLKSVRRPPPLPAELQHTLDASDELDKSLGVQPPVTATSPSPARRSPVVDRTAAESSEENDKNDLEDMIIPLTATPSAQVSLQGAPSLPGMSPPPAVPMSAMSAEELFQQSRKATKTGFRLHHPTVPEEPGKEETEQEFLAHFLPPPAPDPASHPARNDDQSRKMKRQKRSPNRLGTQVDKADKKEESFQAKYEKDSSLYSSMKTQHRRGEFYSGYQPLSDPQNSPKIHEDGAVKYLKKKKESVKDDGVPPRETKQVPNPQFVLKQERIKDLSLKYQKKSYNKDDDAMEGRKNGAGPQNDEGDEKLYMGSDDSFRMKVLLDFDEIGIASEVEVSEALDADGYDRAQSPQLENEDIYKMDDENDKSIATGSLSSISLPSHADDDMQHEFSDDVMQNKIRSVDDIMPFEQGKLSNQELATICETLHQQVDELTDDNRAKETTIFQLEEDLTITKNKLDVKRDIVKKKEQQERVLEVEINKLKQQGKHSQIEKEELASKVRDLQNEIASYKSTICQLEEKVHNTMGHRERSEVPNDHQTDEEQTALKTRLSTLEKENEMLRKQKSDLEIKFKEMNLVQKWQEEELEEMVDLKNEKCKLEEEMSVCMKDAENLATEMTETKKECDEYAIKLDEVTNRNRELIGQLEESQQTINALRHEVGIAKLNVSLKHNELTEKHQKWVKVNEKMIKDLEEKLADSEMKNYMLSDKVLDLQFPIRQDIMGPNPTGLNENTTLKRSSSTPCLSDFVKEILYNSSPLPNQELGMLRMDAPFQAMAAGNDGTSPRNVCIQQLQVALEEAKDEVQEVKQKLQLAEAQQANNDQNYTSLIEQVELEVQAVQQMFEEQHQHNTELRTRLDVLENAYPDGNIPSLERNCKLLDRECKEVRLERDALVQKLEEMEVKAKMNEATQRTSNELQEKLALLQSENEDMKVNISRLEEDLNWRDKKHDQHQMAEILMYKSELNELKQEFELANKEYEEMVKKVSEKNEEISVMKKKSEDAIQTIKKLENEIEQIGKKKTTNKAISVERKNVSGQVCNCMTLEEREMLQENREMELAVFECLTSLVNDVATQEIMEEKDELAQAVVKMSHKNEEFIDRIVMLQHEVQTSRDERDNELICYDRVLSQKEGEIRTLHQIENDLKEELSQWIQKMETMEEELKDKTEAECKMNLYVKELILDIEIKEEEHEQERLALEKKNEMLVKENEETVKDMSLENTKCKAEIEMLKANAKSQEESLAVIQNNMLEVLKENECLKDDQDALKRNIEELYKKLLETSACETFQSGGNHSMATNDVQHKLKDIMEMVNSIQNVKIKESADVVILKKQLDQQYQENSKIHTELERYKASDTSDADMKALSESKQQLILAEGRIAQLEQCLVDKDKRIKEKEAAINEVLAKLAEQTLVYQKKEDETVKHLQEEKRVLEDLKLLTAGLKQEQAHQVAALEADLVQAKYQVEDLGHQLTLLEEERAQLAVQVDAMSDRRGQERNLALTVDKLTNRLADAEEALQLALHNQQKAERELEILHAVRNLPTPVCASTPAPLCSTLNDSKNQSVVEEIQDMRERLVDMDAKYKLLMGVQTKQDMQDKHDQTIRELKQSYGIQLQEASEKVESLQKEIVNLERSRLHDQMVYKEQSVDQSKIHEERIFKMVEQLSKLQMQVAQKQEHKFQNVAHEDESRIHELLNKCYRLERHLEDATFELNKSDATVQSLKHELQIKQDTCDQAVMKLGKKNKEVTALVHDIDLLKKEKISIMERNEKEVLNLEHELECVEDRLRKAEIRILEVVKEKDDEMKLLNSDIQRNKKNSDSQKQREFELSQLAEQVTNANERLHDIESKKEKEIEDLKRRLNKATRQMSSMEESAELEIENFKREIRKLCGKIKVLEDQADGGTFVPSRRQIASGNRHRIQQGPNIARSPNLNTVVGADGEVQNEEIALVSQRLADIYQRMKDVQNAIRSSRQRECGDELFKYKQ